MIQSLIRFRKSVHQVFGSVRMLAFWCCLLAFLVLFAVSYSDGPREYSVRAAGALTEQGDYAQARDVLQYLEANSPNPNPDVAWQRVMTILTREFDVYNATNQEAARMVYEAAVDDINSRDPARQDHGWLMAGLGFTLLDDPAEAWEALCRVRNQDLKYLNYAKGSVMLQWQNPNLAQQYLLREVQANGYVKGASAKLLEMYAEFPVLVTKNRAANLGKGEFSDMPEGLERAVYAANGDWDGYGRAVVRSMFGRYSWSSGLLCLAAALIWLGYLQLIDMFERERPAVLLLAFAAGWLLFHLWGMLSDAAYIVFLPYEWDNDIWKYLFQVGLPYIAVQGIKLLPLLALLRWTREVDEPLDLLIYATASVLGWSLAENLAYFGKDNYWAVNHRLLVMQFVQLASASLLVAWPIIQKPNLYRIPWRFYAFGVLASAGWLLLCDLLLEYSDFSVSYFFLSLGAVLAAVFCMAIVQGRAFARSPFYRLDRFVNFNALGDFVFCAVVLVYTAGHVLEGLRGGFSHVLIGVGCVVLWILLFIMSLSFLSDKDEKSQFTGVKGPFGAIYLIEFLIYQEGNEPPEQEEGPDAPRRGFGLKR